MAMNARMNVGRHTAGVSVAELRARVGADEWPASRVVATWLLLLVAGVVVVTALALLAVGLAPPDAAEVSVVPPAPATTVPVPMSGGEV